MSVEIKREFAPNFSVTANSAAGSTTGRFPYNHFAGGIVYIAASSGCTQINWHAALSQGDTGAQVYDGGNAVTTAVTVGFHPLPDALFASKFVVPIATGATTGMVIQVGLKG
jgi:hypothetical protein